MEALETFVLFLPVAFGLSLIMTTLLVGQPLMDSLTDYLWRD